MTIEEQVAQLTREVSDLKSRRVVQQDIVPASIKQKHLASSLEVAMGDLYYGDGSNNFVRVPIGSDSQVLGTSGGVPTWEPKVGYVLYAFSGTFNPADATTYYIGSVWNLVNSVGGNSENVYIPKSGTVKAVYAFIMTNSAPASSETSTISFRLNNTTDTTISSVVKVDASTQVFSNTGLSVPVVAGDYFEIKWVTPTWVTNPTNVRVNVTVYIE